MVFSPWQAKQYWPIKRTIIIIIIIIIIIRRYLWCSHHGTPLPEFTLFIWWMQRRMVANPQTKPINLDCKSAGKGSGRVHPPSPFIITPPESWYSFYGIVILYRYFWGLGRNSTYTCERDSTRFLLTGVLLCPSFLESRVELLNYPILNAPVSV